MCISVGTFEALDLVQKAEILTFKINIYNKPIRVQRYYISVKNSRQDLLRSFLHQQGMLSSELRNNYQI